MTNAIDRAMAAAEQKANETQQDNQVPATQTEQSGVPSTHVGGGTYGLEDMMVGAMNVDQYIKVNQYGLRVGDDSTLHETLKVRIDMNEVQVCEAIKAGNPPTYYKTYDGVTCAQGGTWAQAVAKAQQIDGNAKPYKSADIPMTLIEEVKDKKGNVVADEGERVGHSLSTTNRGEFQNFIREVSNAGLKDTTIEVTLSFKPRSNSKGNEWGVMTFQLEGASDAA